MEMPDKAPDPRTRIVLLTGDGKGKTSSALGMALRALGNGLRVCAIFFIKRREDVGEVAALRRFPEAEVQFVGRGFVPPLGSPARDAHRAAAVAGLDLAARKLRDPAVDMVILDEICGAESLALLDRAAILAAIRQARPGMIVILTGRNACPDLLALADTVSEVACIKHGQTAGWPAQRGVEL